MFKICARLFAYNNSAITDEIGTGDLDKGVYVAKTPAKPKSFAPGDAASSSDVPEGHGSSPSGDQGETLAVSSGTVPEGSKGVKNKIRNFERGGAAPSGAGDIRNFVPPTDKSKPSMRDGVTHQ